MNELDGRIHHQGYGKVKSLGLIIFDGDDTLWATQPLYEAAKERFIELLPQFPVDPGEVLKRLDEIDAAAVDAAPTLQKFSPSRFPNSLVNTYIELAETFGHRVEPNLIVKIREIGQRVFDDAAPIYPGVHIALKQLKRFYKLVLLTKGDLQVQERRITRSRLRRYFDGIYIVADKSPEEFRRVVAAQNESFERTWSIGNSEGSDIAPAVRLGIRGVLIPNETWLYEMRAGPSRSIQIVRDMTEAEQVLLAHTA